LLKAQALQESALNPAATSWAGAAGLMQIMPATFPEIQRMDKIVAAGTLYDPKISIRAGAIYLRRSVNFWSSKRPWIDKYALGLAGYNAGNGNIHESQKLCNMAVLYEGIMACLHQVTGKHAKETRGYAPGVFRYYIRLQTS